MNLVKEKLTEVNEVISEIGGGMDIPCPFIFTDEDKRSILESLSEIKSIITDILIGED